MYHVAVGTAIAIGWTEINLSRMTALVRWQAGVIRLLQLRSTKKPWTGSNVFLENNGRFLF